MYPFGYGLGYSEIEYSGFKVLNSEYRDGDDIQVEFTIKNLGKYNQYDVPQIYVHRVDSKVEWPYKELKAFQKLELVPGMSVTLIMDVPVSYLKYWDEEKHDWVLEPGKIELLLARDAGNVVAKAECSVK